MLIASSLGAGPSARENDSIRATFQRRLDFSGARSEDLAQRVMQPLRSRKPRAPAGSRRFTRAQKASRHPLPSGPWTPRQALNFALDARDRAQTAARQAADEKARVRTDADRALRAGEASVAHVKERVVAAQQARIPPAALEPMQKALASAEASVASARAAFEKGDYRAAVDTLNALQAHLTRTTSEINAAMTTRQPRRPARRNR